MILNTTSTNDVIKIGESNSKQATINQDKISKLQSMLTQGLYNNPIAATLTELSNNAIDSIVMSGKDPIENPTIVKLTSGNSEYFITISDNGLGLNKDEFENVVMSYLTSTKEDTSSAIGHFGIGAKSFLALNRPSEWICRKEGIEYKFLAYKGSEFLEYDLIYEKETIEENGVSIKIKINDSYEYQKFVTEAKKQLSYYDEITLIVNEQIVKNTIYRNDLFQFCDVSPYPDLHLTLKDVVYKLDWDQLGIGRINIPVALRFNLDSGLIPSISRESLVMNSFSKELILSKIKELADYFVTAFNKTTSYKSFIKAYNNINAYTHSVELCNKQFMINDLISHSNIKINSVTIEGVIHLDLINFKRNVNVSLDNNYSICAIDSSDNKWLKEKFYRHPSLFNYISNDKYTNNKKVVIINESLVGKLKSYLRDKYGTNTYYVYNSLKKRSLKNITQETTDLETNKKKNILVYSFDSYHCILDLDKYSKSLWRDVIKEYEFLMTQLSKSFVNCRDIEFSEPFIQWCVEVKEEQKQKRIKNKVNPEYISKSINKEKGDITIRRFTPNKYNSSLKTEVYTKKIDELNTIHNLVVYFDKSKEVIPHSLFTYNQIFPNIDFVVLNPTEVKHVTNLHNFKPFKQFNMSKPFARLATQLLTSDILNIDIDSNIDIINECFPKYQALREKLENYLENSSSKDLRISSNVKSIILKESEETDNWDQIIYPELIEYKNIISKFGFLNYLKNIDDWRNSDQEKFVIKNMIYIMYKNNNLNKEMVEKMVLVPRSSLCIDGINSLEEVEITESESLADQLINN